eukprot:5532404-Amphidinium_carterae.1
MKTWASMATRRLKMGRRCSKPSMSAQPKEKGTMNGHSNGKADGSVDDGLEGAAKGDDPPQEDLGGAVVLELPALQVASHSSTHTQRGEKSERS